MLSVLFVCLFVCGQGGSKSCASMFVELDGYMWQGRGTKRLEFGTNLIPELHPGSVLPLFITERFAFLDIK